MAHIHGGFGDVDVYSELCCMKCLHFAMKIFMEMHHIPPAAPADAGKDFPQISGLEQGEG